MEPARTIIEKLGGPRKVAAVTRTAYTAPYRWQQPVEKGGTGGSIPMKHVPALLEFARVNGVPLSAADFIPSTPVTDTASPGNPNGESVHG